MLIGSCAPPLQCWSNWGCPGWEAQVGWSADISVLLSVSLVVAQRLTKLDFPVKDNEEPSAPGADKNHFLRPRGPGEDTGKVSATDTWVLSWAEARVESVTVA